MKRILIVDDEFDLRDGLYDFFVSQKYEVRTAEHGERAKFILEQEGFDFHLIITDLGMPKVNGYELIEYIRTQGANMPIIVMSALVNDQEKEQLDRLRSSNTIQAFFNKPFNTKHLYYKVIELIENES